MIETPQNHGAVLAQEPVTFTIDIQRKWWQRYFPKRYPPKKEYKISPLKHGNTYRVSDILLKVKATKDAAKGQETNIAAYHKLNHLHGKDLCRIVAVAISNSKEGPPESLVDELYWNLEPSETLRLAVIVLQQMNIQGFTLTLDLMCGMSAYESVKENATESPARATASPQVPGNMQAA